MVGQTCCCPRTVAFRAPASSPRSRVIFSAQRRFERRDALMGGGVLAQLYFSNSACAVPSVPPGYLRFTDQLEGYTFTYPDSWIPITTSGNPASFRNSRRADENLFVLVSSPSSSRYRGVADLGSPEEASEMVRNQLLAEFMSTRIGVRRVVDTVSAEARTGEDGGAYYDIVQRVRSYASRSQLAVTAEEREGAVIQEFDRAEGTTLGVANDRLYALRWQAPWARFSRDPAVPHTIAKSFRCYDV